MNRELNKALEMIKKNVNSYNQISEMSISEIMDSFNFSTIDFSSICTRLLEDGINIVTEDELIHENTGIIQNEFNQIKELFLNLSFSDKCKCLSELSLLIDNSERINPLLGSMMEKDMDSVNTRTLPQSPTSSGFSCSSIKYDFEDNIDMAFSKPLSITHKNIVIRKNNWTDLYVEFIKALSTNDNYLKQITHLANAGYTTIVNQLRLSQLRRPKKVASNIYLESNMDTTDKIRQIRIILDACRIPYNEVELLYIKKK